MRRRKNFGVCVRAAWTFALIGTGVVAVAQSLLPAEDGWYAWTVEARTDDQRCCFKWDNGDGRATQCQLDGTSVGFGSSNHLAGSNDEAVVYVKQARGQIERTLALSSSCKVSTGSPIRYLDDVTDAHSVALLSSALDQDASLADEVFGALAAHKADAATSLLLTSTRKGNPSEMRSKAWFWLAQTAWPQLEEVAMTALLDDPSHKVRQDTVFALSQLPSARATKALIRVAETSRFDRRDRKQALFWLAQDNGDESLEYLTEILR